jgi:hypothetical protein
LKGIRVSKSPLVGSTNKPSTMHPTDRYHQESIVVSFRSVQRKHCIPHYSHGISTLTGSLVIIPALVFDALVGGFLIFGLYQSSRLYGTKMPLVKLIVRDGILYFAVVFITNIAWVVVYVLENDKGVSYPPLVTLLHVVDHVDNIVHTIHTIHTVGNVSLRLVLHGRWANAPPPYSWSGWYVAPSTLVPILT